MRRVCLEKLALSEEDCLMPSPTRRTARHWEPWRGKCVGEIVPPHYTSFSSSHHGWEILAGLEICGLVSPIGGGGQLMLYMWGLDAQSLCGCPWKDLVAFFGACDSFGGSFGAVEPNL